MLVLFVTVYMETNRFVQESVVHLFSECPFVAHNCYHLQSLTQSSACVHTKKLEKCVN